MERKSYATRSVCMVLLMLILITMTFVTVKADTADAATYYSMYETGPFKGEYADEDYDYVELSGNVVPTTNNYKSVIDYNINTGGSVFKGSGQCWGYAEKVRKLFGSGSKYVSVRKKSTAKNIYNTLKNVRPGTHVRFGTTKSGDGSHSIAVYKVTSDKIYYSDANWGGYNDIHHHVMDLETYADWYSYGYILWYREPTGSCGIGTCRLYGSYDADKNRIQLYWRPVSGASSYTLYRSTSKNGTYKKVKTVTSARCTDSGAPKGAVYYKIKTSNGKWSSPKLIYNKLASPKVKVTITNKGNSKLSWNKVTGASKYKVYKGYYDSNYNLKWKCLKTTTGTSYTITTKTTDEIPFRVVAVYKNTKANSVPTEGYTYQRAPKAKIYSYDTYSGWDYYNDKNYINVEIDAGILYPYSKSYDMICFKLYRATEKDGKYTYVNTFCDYPTSLNYKTYRLTLSDSFGTAKAGKTYYYKVAAGTFYSDYYGGIISSAFTVKLPTDNARSIGGGRFHIWSNGSIYYVDSNGYSYTFDEVIYTCDDYVDVRKGESCYRIDSDGLYWFSYYSDYYDDDEDDEDEYSGYKTVPSEDALDVKESEEISDTDNNSLTKEPAVIEEKEEEKEASDRLSSDDKEAGSAENSENTENIEDTESTEDTL